MRRNVFLPISLLLLSLTFLTSCASTKDHYVSRKASNAHKNRSNPSERLRKVIVKDAKNLLGVKYRYGGKTPKAFDCSGYTSYVMGNHGISIPPGSSVQASFGKKVPASKVKPGDLLFFGKRGNINHVAIVVENSISGMYIIHSTTSKGVIIDNVSKSRYWSDRLLYGRDVID